MWCRAEYTKTLTNWRTELVETEAVPHSLSEALSSTAEARTWGNIGKRHNLYNMDQ